LELDRFGTETTWSIETQDGFTAFTGGPYVNSPDGYTVDEHVCLTHDCYVFTINDAVGDGICCDYGEGAFQIQDTTGAVLLDGYPEFEFSQSSPFCMNWVGVEEAVSADMRIWPNPNIGVFNVAFGDGAAPRSLSVRDALGRVVWTGNAPLGNRSPSSGPAECFQRCVRIGCGRQWSTCRTTVGGATVELLIPDC
jgi:hypothetical protein